MYLTILLVTFLVHHIDCVGRAQQADLSDVNAKLFEYQHDSIQDKFLASIKDVDLLDIGLEKLTTIAKDTAAGAIPGGSATRTAVVDVIQQFLDAKKRKKLKKAEATAIESEIEYIFVSQQLINIENKLSTIRYELQKLQKPPYGAAKLWEIDNELYGVIETFFEVDSPFIKYPALALKTLLAVAEPVEIFMEKLKSSENSAYATTEVPCMLQFTFVAYFVPAVFYRLNEIRVNTDQDKYMYKYEIIYDIIDLLNKGEDQKYDGNQINCKERWANKKEYEIRVQEEFPRFKGGFSFTKLAKSGWQYISTIVKGDGLKSTKYAYEAFFSLNMEKNQNVYLWDNLGDGKTYFVGDDNDNSCIDDYFGVVEVRMFDKYKEAVSKLGEICGVKIYNNTGILVFLKITLQSFIAVDMLKICIRF